MMSLWKLGVMWPALLVLALPGLPSANLFAQPAGQGQPGSPGSLEQLKAAAAAEVQNGENAKAIHDIQRALAIQGNWKEGWWRLGTLQYEAN